MLYACNVKEDELSNSSENPHVINLQSWTSEQQDASSCIISAKMEEELSELSDEDISEYLEAISFRFWRFKLNSIYLRPSWFSILFDCWRKKLEHGHLKKE